MQASANTRQPDFYIGPDAGLGTTEVPESAPGTTASIRRLTVSTGMRTLDEVIWGDAHFDSFTATRIEQLTQQGATPAAGNPVDVRE